MSLVRLHRFDVSDASHGQVPCALVTPAEISAPLPLCLFLYGGGGSRDSLAELAPLLGAWWETGLLPPLAIATPDVGPWSFYLDDPARGTAWESFVACRFMAHVRASFLVRPTPEATALVGISMGGYGALKIALARPREFAAVAAISPMIEPAREAREVKPRNCYHYPPEVPQALLGARRDEVLYRQDHPAARAWTHSAALRGAELALYIDAAGQDALHAHDGAEYLHRVLWELDVPHEYRLRQDSDHVGPDLLTRLHDAFGWAAARIGPRAPAPLTEGEQAWQAWLERERPDPPSVPLEPTSALFPRFLRAQLSGLREAAERLDPTMTRRYGELPSTLPSGEGERPSAPHSPRW